jgi:anti-sigma-K factor RskA
MNYLRPERLEALARDYALGTLQGRARRRFERVLAEHAAAAQAVAAWQRRLDTLAATVPRIAPRPAVWQQLEARLFAAPPVPAVPARPWWQRVFGAPALGGALAGVVLSLAVVQQQPAWLGLEPAQETLPQSYVGLLLDGEGRPTVLASSRRHGRSLTVKMLQPLAIPPGQVAQLWALPKDGGAPFAVGTLPAKGSATITLAAPAEKLFFGVTRLAVSFEPAAGAAAPGTPFVLSGHCVKLW